MKDILTIVTIAGSILNGTCLALVFFIRGMPYVSTGVLLIGITCAVSPFYLRGDDK